MLFYAFYFYYQFASRQREGERKERKRERDVDAISISRYLSLSLNAVAFFLVKQMIIYANVSSRRKESKQKSTEGAGKNEGKVKLLRVAQRRRGTNVQRG